MSFDIQLSLDFYRPRDKIRRGEMRLLFSGKDCNAELLNGLGRVMMKRIPTYAFPSELINIERISPESGFTGSIPFNNDYMRLPLSQFPLLGIDSGLSFLHEKYWKDIDYRDKNREKHPNEKTIEAYVDVKNTTNDIIHVTSNDMSIYIFDHGKDSDKIQIYDTEYPMLVISLRPKEHFKCSMKAVLGLGLRHNIWNSAANYWSDQETYPGKILFCFQSSCIDERVLFERGLQHYHDKLILYKQEIKRAFLAQKEQTNKFDILLKNEDHTFGAAINYEFQSHKDIKKSGCAKLDHLISEITISVVGEDKDSLLSAMMESFDALLAKVDMISTLYKKIGSSEVKQEVKIETSKKKKGRKKI